MNKSLRWLAVGVVAVVCAAPAVQAEGWSLKKLNPFAKSASSSKKRSTAKPSWKLPKWKTPAPIKKVNQSTTKMAVKTWDTLTFWDNGKSSKKNAWGTGAKPYKRREVEKESWLDNLFTAKEEKPKTPNEFLSKRRPEDVIYDE